MPCWRSRRSTGSPPRRTPSSSSARPTGNAPVPGVVRLTVQKARSMLDDTFGWSHARGNEVVPSPWQATMGSRNTPGRFLSWTLPHHGTEAIEKLERHQPGLRSDALAPSGSPGRRCHIPSPSGHQRTTRPPDFVSWGSSRCPASRASSRARLVSVAGGVIVRTGPGPATQICGQHPPVAPTLSTRCPIDGCL